MTTWVFRVCMCMSVRLYGCALSADLGFHAGHKHRTQRQQRQQSTSAPHTATPTLIREPASQSTSQPGNQPTNQTINQPTNQPDSQPANNGTSGCRCPANQPINQANKIQTNQQTNQSTIQPTSQPTNQPTNKQTNQPAKQTSIQPANQPSERSACTHPRGGVDEGLGDDDAEDGVGAAALAVHVGGGHRAGLVALAHQVVDVLWNTTQQ